MTEAESIAALSEAVVTEAIDAGQSVAVAESCTGGWIAKAITDINGSSACFEYGIVSYSDCAKKTILGVHPTTLSKHGAVSEEVVREMVLGVQKLSSADIGVAVSGIAGPGGGSEDKPVGTVWIAWSHRGKEEDPVDTEKHLIQGDRDAVRSRTVILALQGIRERIRMYGR
jgi:nicotinamide-nucleotide amidase